MQYDHYGAVILIENISIFYDHYGRLSGVGGLFIHYNSFNKFSHYTRFINIYNREYIYRPWHYYSIPLANLCIVNNKPYRRYYNPIRYRYYTPNRENHRRLISNGSEPLNHRKAHNNRQSNRYVLQNNIGHSNISLDNSQRKTGYLRPFKDNSQHNIKNTVSSKTQQNKRNKQKTMTRETIILNIIQILEESKK